MRIYKAYEKKVLKIFQETFGQLKNSLYFCTRNSEQTTERVSGYKRKEKRSLTYK